MPAIESQMMPLGSPALDFTLPDPSGTVHSLSDAGEAPVVVVAFICNHCPYVKHIAPALAGVSSEMIDRGVAVFGINSNDAAQYPDDSPEQMERESAVLGYRFPYLVDGDQSVARAYGAVCTPDLFVFDRDRNLAYRGQFDSTRPSSGGPATGVDLVDAVEALLAGRPVPEPQQPSLGCSIKWKPGNEPG